MAKLKENFHHISYISYKATNRDRAEDLGSIPFVSFFLIRDNA